MFIVKIKKSKKIQKFNSYQKNMQTLDIKNNQNNSEAFKKSFQDNLKKIKKQIDTIGTTKAKLESIQNPLWNEPLESLEREIIQKETANCINALREKNALNPLVLNEKLNQAAQLHAEDMAKRNFFSHINPEGKNPWQRAIDAWYLKIRIVENIGQWKTISSIVNVAWLESPWHAANMLAPWAKDIGVGYYQWYMVVVIGKKM